MNNQLEILMSSATRVSAEMDFLGKRIVISLVAFFAALNLDFILPRLVPGSAAEVLASGSRLPAVEVALIKARFGLNEPLTTQYYLYLKNVFSWPPYFGVSYQYFPQSVTDLIANRLVWTIILIASSFILSLVISYTLAGISSMKRGGKFEFGSVFGSIMLWSTPAFWIGMILIWLFGVWLGWLPISGNVAFNPGTGVDYYVSVLTHAILPVLTLTAVVFGQSYFILRGAAQEVLRSDYILAARARGMTERVIAFGYVLRNSLLPIVSLLGYSIASLLSAVVIVEAVFGYTGIGDLIVDGVVNRDYPVLEGAFFYVTIIVIIGGLLGDFLLLKLDPRLRR
jgi:peptide/nickel transport system permease protein